MRTNLQTNGANGEEAPLVLRLREHLDSGAAKPGDRLPPERDLASELKVGRGSLRRALATLEQEGLIWRHVGQGTFYTGSQANNLAGTLSATVSPAEVLDMRLMLEPSLSGSAAVNATAQDIKHLRHCLERSQRASGWRAFERWDAELHRAIALATHNTVAVTFHDVLAAVRARPDWVKLKQQSLTPSRHSKYNRQHGELVEAISARDTAAARRISREHLEEIRNNLLNNLG
ncbi:MAG: FadR/GntR family transcriptional regulator [Kiloniellales bacterium]